MSSVLPSFLDPRLLRVREALEANRPRPLAGDPALEGRTRAAVAVVLRGGRDLEILLIRRARSERDPWSGHMAFPGGRADPSDPSLLHTALREAQEETGIRLDPAERLLGELDPVAPSSRHLPPLVIAPFVFAGDAGVEVVPDPREVADALWVPLDHFRDSAARQVIRVPVGGVEVPFPAWAVGDQVVWGLTYRILNRFLEVVEGGGSQGRLRVPDSPRRPWSPEAPG